MATIISRSAGDTFEFGRTLANSLKRGDVLALDGELGSGKTQLVKGLAAGLGSTTAITSPTFTLVREHHGGRMPFYHFDFYRLDDATAALEIGLDEYMNGEGVVAIEWAGKFPELIPAHARWLRFKHVDENTRHIELG
jgi:tRNA threonylcarbamoyladenosine biosynthesis protein TsaE